mgnify:CR=1 FL=1
MERVGRCLLLARVDDALPTPSHGLSLTFDFVTVRQSMNE